MTTIEIHADLAACHYDFYKEVYGIRPRWMDYDSMSVEELQAELDSLSKQAEKVFAAEETRKLECSIKFEERVQLIIQCGAGNRKTALRWIMEADGAGGDWEYLCYINGLSYGYFKESV